MIHLLMLTILVGISSWPVWGWAGEKVIEGAVSEFGFTLKPNCSMSDGKGGWFIYECGNPPEVTCNYRMREAMRTMDQFTAWRELDRYPPGVMVSSSETGCTDECARNADRVFNRKLHKHQQAKAQAKQQWDATMHDCVEGGK